MLDDPVKAQSGEQMGPVGPPTPGTGARAPHSEQGEPAMTAEELIRHIFSWELAPGVPAEPGGEVTPDLARGSAR
jgi:hypothetical protein